MALSKTCAGYLECRGCKIPFKFRNVEGLDDEILRELRRFSDTSSRQDDREMLVRIAQRKLESKAMRNIVLPISVKGISTDPYMFVGEMDSLPLHDYQRSYITDTLRNLMSEDHASVDQPLCKECADGLLELMDTELQDSEAENVAYGRFLKNFKGKEELEKELRRLKTEEDVVSELEEELRRLKTEEAELEAELRDCETEVATVKERLESCEKQAESHEKEARKTLIEYNKTTRELLSLNDCQRSVDNQATRAEDRLRKVASTDVFHTAFVICDSGDFGSINGFRLGRLSTVPVEWSEINAAWGQTVLLLHCLVKKINFTFRWYRLVPCGGQSYIVQIDDKTKYLPLYFVGDAEYVSQFDSGMVAFLSCLQQFKERIQRDGDFHLPYRIDRGNIGDEKRTYSVKSHLNSYERWTEALRFILINLKWALTWVSDQSEDNR